MNNKVYTKESQKFKLMALILNSYHKNDQNSCPRGRTELLVYGDIAASRLKRPPWSRGLRMSNMRTC